MPRDGLATDKDGVREVDRSQERSEPVFGRLQGGPLSHWTVQERRSA